jgi:hypothetical protein
MLRLRLALLVVLGVALVGTAGLLGDDKAAPAPKQSPVDDKTPPGLPPGTKIKTSLPKLWSKLGLSDEQKRRAQQIQTMFGMRIARLREEIKMAQDQEKVALNSVLTPAQKDRLGELAKEQAGVGDSSKDDKKADEAKDEKKDDKKKDSEKK